MKEYKRAEMLGSAIFIDLTKVSAIQDEKDYRIVVLDNGKEYKVQAKAETLIDDIAKAKQ
ncbi:hypothetical protein [Vibrio coralliilyticus]|uniref:Uncharacterized protein n=1 Tax=Vibrio coralliilyticus TaxID=190893 RepID=A0AAP7DFU0_9VIBR|nr:hypothetical protein [Vibrio coralliilyticus]NOI31809.1 hypothetical protein [Vibrio coralliilyticus]NOJ25252.1 hypothetical protein [Vibrio coralliilyticus]